MEICCSLKLKTDGDDERVNRCQNEHEQRKVTRRTSEQQHVSMLNTMTQYTQARERQRENENGSKSTNQPTKIRHSS